MLAAIFAALLAAQIFALGSIWDLNRQAIEMAQKGDLQGALQTFTSALKTNPKNQELLNNVGVTLMRMGKLNPALEAFEKVLSIDPGHQDAVDNRRELLAFMKKSESGMASFRPRELKPRLQLPRITSAQLYSPGYEHYAEGRRPFILVGATSKWALFGKDGQWPIQYLKSEFFNSTVDFYPHNMGRSTTRPYMVPFLQAMTEFWHPSGEFSTDPAYPGTYIQWNVPHKEWGQLRELMHPMPKPFRSDEKWLRECLVDSHLIKEYSLKLHWRMVLIGSDKAGMFFHKDVLRASSWQVQVTGRKRWTLCDPVVNQGSLYDPGDVDTFTPDLVKFPRFADSVCYDAIVSRGEMLFYPSDYWHQTLNLDTPTLSISGTIVDDTNYESVTDEFQAECAHGKWKWNLSSELCDALQDCFDLWDDGGLVPRHTRPPKVEL